MYPLLSFNVDSPEKHKHFVLEAFVFISALLPRHKVGYAVPPCCIFLSFHFISMFKHVCLLHAVIRAAASRPSLSPGCVWGRGRVGGKLAVLKLTYGLATGCECWLIRQMAGRAAHHPLS